ncbi:hypothetical protein BPNPMPFG_004420 [Mesorhizobium sp. AR07]|uniref:hypothetical protein n=1 Tax=Mesorhizobium sp. AR07 TaxID=2865838 RepID=UPI002160D2F0|nr:hypothetical protein [Mesorhizobium sp. AR07]UVK42712.1 hypothetical protein BPNPMPFG_004420 [Mesorhizobium sp. AR07]
MSGNQISRLISPCPQPASRRTTDSKHVDVIKVLKIVTSVTPPQMDHPSWQFSGSIQKMNRQATTPTYETFILMLETSQ